MVGVMVALAFACSEAPPVQEEVAPPTEVTAVPIEFQSPLVSTAWLAANLDRDDVIVLHVERRDREYTGNHIPGARYVPITDITWDGEQGWRFELRSVAELEEALGQAGVTNDSYVVVTGTRTTTTARLWMTLDYLGHGDRAALLDGGLQAWGDEGRSLEKGDSPSVVPTQFVATVREGMQVNADWIAHRLLDPAVALLDARPDDEYTGEDGGMGGMANPGHIPGAVQLYWEDLTVEGNPHKFKSRAELATLYEQSGVLQDGATVSYCMVGLRASVNYMVGRMLGYDMRFYDGSWHDWGTRDDLPFVSGPEPAAP
jgi:thiosulfate/3-mercaptopyruvate sulfurtransferase